MEKLNNILSHGFETHGWMDGWTDGQTDTVNYIIQTVSHGNATL